MRREVMEGEEEEDASGMDSPSLRGSAREQPGKDSSEEERRRCCGSMQAGRDRGLLATKAQAPEAAARAKDAERAVVRGFISLLLCW